MRTWRIGNLIFRIVLCLLLCTGFGLFAYYSVIKGNRYYSNEKYYYVEVTNGTELAEALNSGHIGQEIQIENDITLYSSHLSLGKRTSPFQGILNGNGHKITIYTEALANPLFDYLGENATIENLYILISTEFPLEVESSFSVLCNYNYGTIKNIKFEMTKELKIQSSGVYSLASIKNYGTISNCLFESYVKDYSSEPHPFLYANACVYNYGTLSNLITRSTGSNIYPSIYSEEEALSFQGGYFFAENYNVVRHLFVFNETEGEGERFEYLSTDIKDVSTPEFITFFQENLLVDEYGFDKDIWDLSTFQYNLDKFTESKWYSKLNFKKEN